MGHALAGRGITWGVLLTASAGLGSGRSATVILRRMPGCCWFQSAKAAWPVTTWGLEAALSTATAMSGGRKAKVQASAKAEAKILRELVLREWGREEKLMGPLMGMVIVETPKIEQIRSKPTRQERAPCYLDAGRAGSDSDCGGEFWLWTRPV